jgi:hypothetical protein
VLEGDKVIQHTPFLTINKRHIVWLMPIESPNTTNSQGK